MHTVRSGRITLVLKKKLTLSLVIQLATKMHYIYNIQRTKQCLKRKCCNKSKAKNARKYYHFSSEFFDTELIHNKFVLHFPFKNSLIITIIRLQLYYTDLTA